MKYRKRKCKVDGLNHKDYNLFKNKGWTSFTPYYDSFREDKSFIGFLESRGIIRFTKFSNGSLLIIGIDGAIFKNKSFEEWIFDVENNGCREYMEIKAK